MFENFDSIIPKPKVQQVASKDCSGVHYSNVAMLLYHLVQVSYKNYTFWKELIKSMCVEKYVHL